MILFIVFFIKLSLSSLSLRVFIDLFQLLLYYCCWRYRRRRGCILFLLLLLLSSYVSLSPLLHFIVAAVRVVLVVFVSLRSLSFLLSSSLHCLSLLLLWSSLLHFIVVTVLVVLVVVSVVVVVAFFVCRCCYCHHRCSFAHCKFIYKNWNVVKKLISCQYSKVILQNDNYKNSTISQV